MYLDDGVSRNSAPETTFIGRDEATLGNDARKHRLQYEDAFGDEDAKSMFNHVKISHVSLFSIKSTSDEKPEVLS